MIVPMKKVVLLMQPKDAGSALESLRSLGLLHIEHQQLSRSQETGAIQDEIQVVDKAIKVLLEQQCLTADKVTGRHDINWKNTAGHIVDLDMRINNLKEDSLDLRNQISQCEPWGDFDPLAVADLSKKQVYLGFYQVPTGEIKNLPGNLIVKKISGSAGMVNYIIIASRKPDLPFKELSLPKMGLNKLRQRLEEDIEVISSLKEEITKYVPYRHTLIEAKKFLENELEFQRTLRGMGKDGEITYVTGYIPFDAVAQIEKVSRFQQWGIIVRDPAQEDIVPTLIRNPRWVSIVDPIFKMIEIIPGYRELDMSLWFLLFFSIFFGMLIGDAGYGATFLMLTFMAQKKWSRKLTDKSVFILFYILSSSAIIWGLLTATFFGQEWLPTYFRPLMPALKNDKNLQAFCFFLGATHLSIAHLWRFITKLPSVIALADAGWISVLWGGFFLARTLVLGDFFPAAAKWFFIAGPILVVFFSSPRKNVFQGIGIGLGNLLLNIVNSFTDVVSYIRLFAVGLATVAVADSFNAMGMSIGYSNLLRGAMASLILILGHALNLALGPMSILVHGIRLNVLEFSNHLDIKWSGFAYNPLKWHKLS
ncbi:hypothetical protein D4R78_02580 [bacterium]|nr:MAG: hypothetical protein D4R78_02580 [bacterium]